MINELPENKTAYIKIKTTDNMSNLTKDLQKLFNLNFQYVFIDEITLMEDFIGMEHRFGKIAGKYVLYRGKTQFIGEIQYLNVEEFLISLKK